MPQRRTRQRASLRASLSRVAAFRFDALRSSPLRLTALLVAATMAIPFVQPSATFAISDNPRWRGSGSVEDAFQVTLASRRGRHGRSRGAGEGQGNGTVPTSTNTGSVSCPCPRCSASWRDASCSRIRASPRSRTTPSPVKTLVPNDPQWERQWNLRHVRAPEAWQATRGEPSTIIAIIDTGVDPSHPDLRGRVVQRLGLPQQRSESAGRRRPRYRRGDDRGCGRKRWSRHRRHVLALQDHARQGAERARSRHPVEHFRWHRLGGGPRRRRDQHESWLASRRRP